MTHLGWSTCHATSGRGDQRASAVLSADGFGFEGRTDVRSFFRVGLGFGVWDLLTTDLSLIRVQGYLAPKQPRALRSLQ